MFLITGRGNMPELSILSKSNFMKSLILLALIIPFSLVFGQEENEEVFDKYQIFPDEYSDLDDIHSPYHTNDEFIVATLELARQKYIQALIFAEKGENDKAAKFFSQAVDEMNGLASYPDINMNPDFADLAQLLIDDYENFVEKSNLIDENAPLFIIRDKLFSDTDDEIDIAEGEIKTLKDQNPNFVSPTMVPDTIIIPLPENTHVKKSIKWLSETKLGRRIMEKWIERSSRWFPMMRRIAKEEGMPEEIIYLSMIESGLKTGAVSRASAVGLWQFMYATGKDYGLNANDNIWIDERRDPEKSTRAAMRFLKSLYNEFGDWHLALAAYNCGGGRVRRAIRRTKKKNPDYWDIRNRLPRETRYYVPRYISTALIAMEPKAYNFNVDTLNYSDEYVFENFPLTEPVNLEVLAKCANISDSAIKELNPELVKSTTPPDQSIYQLRIPEGTLKNFAANFALLSEEEKQPWVDHTIKGGENLSKISKKYGVSVAELAALNSIKNPRSRLRTGGSLRIPITATKYNEINIAAERSGTYFPIDGTRDIIHTVSRGESLYLIANKYGVTINHIRDMNGLSRRQSNLQIGQQLFVAKKSKDAITEKVSDEKAKEGVLKVVRHRVDRGETLNSLAEVYKTTSDEIKKLNRLTSNTLRTGSYLKIKTTVALDSFKKPESETPTSSFTYHTVRRGETLGYIARKYGISLSSLKNDNNIRSNRIYPGQKIKVFGNTRTPVYSQSVASNVNIPTNHKVRRGETLFEIAKQFGVSVNDIKLANNITGSSIYPGQTLKIEKYNGSGTVSNTVSTNNSSSKTEFIIHTVKRGETLGHIAENYNTRAQSIRDWNNISGSNIRVGQKLKIASPYKQGSIANASTETHLVKRGETVSSIAAKYGISERQLKDLNQDKIKGNNIYAGSKLRVIEADINKGGNTNKETDVKTNPTYYNLKKGETLASVARKFGLSVQKIQELNPDVNPRKLQIGQKIRVK